MRKIKKYLSLFIFLPLLLALNVNDNPPVVIQQVALDGNNINAWFFNIGIFDQDLRISNHPGLEWPKGSGKYAWFTAGLSIGAIVNNQLREAMCSYKGELAPGYIIDSAGYPKTKTDSRFKIYKVSRNEINSQDWLNWQNMIPYGAPFTDYNHNGVYEPFIDTPGVRYAVQTLFACLTDGFPEEHKLGEGFGGGTPPLFAEYHMTAWCYDKPGVQDIQYIKWVVINKNNYLWDSTFFGITSDPDLGFADDDYVGCDTVRRLGFCYNGDNDDAGNTYSYGLNPPASGIKYIRSAKNNSGNYLGLTSFCTFTGTSTPGAACEKDPNGEPYPAYNLLRGLKKDRSPWVIPPGGPNKRTKFIYSGDPETGQGWNEGIPGNPSGCVYNCGGPNSDTGIVVLVNSVGDKRFILTSGSNTLKVFPNDSQTIVVAQLIARGSSNLNSVTKLKQLSDDAQTFYDSGYVIGVSNISSDIPHEYRLYQNYPNPFNPVTKIKIDISSNVKRQTANVKLIVYDITGKVVETLIDKEMKAGSYSADWNASNYSSGIYFYSLLIDNKILETRKMVLIK